MNESTSTQADRTTGGDLDELVITRVYDAPVALVYECMTTPAHLTHFWGPPGVSTPLDKIVLELHVGGRFETTMVSDDTGEEYLSSGVFTEIVPNERLTWRETGAAEGVVNESTFRDLGDGRTEVVIHQYNLPAMFRSPEAQAGFNASLDRFAAYVADLARR